MDGMRMMRRGDGLFLVSLAILVACCYAPGLAAPAMHDDALISERILGPASPANLFHRFLEPVPWHGRGIALPSYAYRPLTEASFILNLPWKTTPSILALRLGNVLIHWVAVLLVFALGRRLAPEPVALARWAAAFFALHPLAVPAVTYVYERSTSLEALLVFLVLLLYLNGRRGWAWLAGLLAMGTKETAVTLPLLIGAVEWITRKPGEKPSAMLRRWLPFALLPGVVLVQVLRASHATGVERGIWSEARFHPDPWPAIPFSYLLGEFPVLFRYLRLSLWPFPLHFYYDPAGYLPWTLSAALAGGLLLRLMFGPATSRLPRLGLALFVAPLALEVLVLAVRDAGFNHRAYPGLLGAGLLFGWGSVRVGRCVFLPIVSLGLLGALAWAGNRDWADPARLLGADLRQDPLNPVAWSSYAGMRLLEGRPEPALAFFRMSRRLPWQTVPACAGEAGALISLGRPAEAKQVLEEGMKALPGDPALLWTAVLAAQASGDSAWEECLAGRAEGMAELRPETVFWLARRRMTQGRLSEAERILRRYLDRFPADRAALQAHLAWVLAAQGRTTGAPR